MKIMILLNLKQVCLLFNMKALILLILIFQIHSLYTPYYKRCRLNKNKIDDGAIALQNLQIERIPNYYVSYNIEPNVEVELDLDYREFQYYYIDYIDAGGSGEVYLVEDEQTGQGKIVKRYFREKPSEFKRQNFIMQRLNYSIEWAKDCQEIECLENQTNFHTMAIFPQKQSIILRKLEFDAHEAPLLFYKILKELDKTHKKGIIHDDIKMGNIMVNSLGPHFKFYQVQLIDWNLASFYHTGVDLNSKRGTVCYYSPEQLFLTYHITPAIDVWALGVVMFTYFTDSKPFSINCKSHNLKAIATLVGAQKLLALYKKYRYNNIEVINFLMQLQIQQKKYQEKDFGDIKIKSNKQHYTKQLMDVFRRMLEPDPQLRATPQELINMPYFKKIKTLPKMYSMKRKKIEQDGDKEKKKSLDHH